VPARTWEPVSGSSGSLMVHVASGVSAASVSQPAVPVAATTAVLVHDFPLEEAGADRTGRALPMLADRLAAESGWRVLAGCLRGVGGSAGDFSLCSWLEDLAVLVEHAIGLAAGGGVWAIGFGVGGSISLCLAAAQPLVRGVGCLGSPATFADWGLQPAAMLEAARQVGVVRSDGFPPNLSAWAHEFAVLRPLEAAAAMGPRSLLVVHGSEDDDVPVSDARQLADAAGPSAELHVLPGAAHHLQADPRALALLLGWMERQG
jgi:pimeloyl-ACP methyl ester carboxylesterase